MLRDLVDRVDNLARVLTRQTAAIERLTDDARTRAARERAGADVGLLVELLALRGDATACAATARSRRERVAFAAVASGLERLLVGHGGALVEPAPEDPFDALAMEAAAVVGPDDPALDRTVEEVLEPGLRLVEADRSVRPARVVVRRHRPAVGPTA